MPPSIGVYGLKRVLSTPLRLIFFFSCMLCRHVSTRLLSPKPVPTTTKTSTYPTSTMTTEHDAAILPQSGGPLSVGKRPTPEPGPNEVLIEVKAVALNPCDYYQRDHGMPPVPIYPAVLGSDTAGVVAKLGSNVTTVPGPGSRVIAFASSFYQNGSPDHGAFQKFTLAQSELVIPLPDDLSFEEGAVFPMAVSTALTAWTAIGILLDTRYTPADKQAVLIWGASSSVGTFAVQSAKSLGFTVYAKVAHSPVLPEGHPTLDNTQITFNFPSMDEAVRNKHFYEVFHGWLSSGLKSGAIVPSPNIQIEGGGLGGVHGALDKLKHGVSGTKIVVPI
ncbi:GroES-like protein [Trichoderma pleuroticola]